jgi:hypothetical protein
LIGGEGYISKNGSDHKISAKSEQRHHHFERQEKDNSAGPIISSY